jgi:geranylgeranyl diphosphate synthase type II
MIESLCQFIESQRLGLEQALDEALPRSRQPQAARLNGALEYSLFPGGKRWRPMLTLIGAQLTSARPQQALPAACAMEFLHTSSLILDDLPAMDDASLRRGRPALHCVYGESVALLAALALLNSSYGLLTQAAREHGHCEAALRLLDEAGRCIGSDGMIGGQVVDLVLCGKGQSDEALESRNLKTTALMRLTLVAGALACGASERETATLGYFGDALGTAYQICDDLLDEFGASASLGKPAGQDARHARASYLAELGATGAYCFAINLIEDGLQALRSQFGERREVEWLAEAAALIVNSAGELAALNSPLAPSLKLFGDLSVAVTV